MDELLTEIVEQWYLTEPALFRIYCLQRTVVNTQMRCAVRCGQGRVEYNPQLLTEQKISKMALEEMMRVEMIRLYLKHPYERQPEGCLPESLSIGSNMVIGQHYRLNHVPYCKASDFQLPDKECFEWYVNKLNVLLRQPPMSENRTDSLYQAIASADGELDESQDDESQADAGNGDEQNDGDQQGNGQPSAQSQNTDENGNGSSSESENNNGQGGNNQQDGNQSSVQSQNPNRGGGKPNLSDEARQQQADNAELWQEDELRREEINEVIRTTTNWGTVPGEMVEQILASLVVKMDYRRVLSSFHTSILSSKRHLTRMRPNRRSGFAQMGSRYDLMSRLLVAVDVSGSIDSRTLQAFYSVVARFFKYGVEAIDVVQFDVGLREVVTFKKRPLKVEVCGRGGTSFQEVFDYLKQHGDYDGLLIFTDGYAPAPKVDFVLRTKVLWVCCSEHEYNQHHEWMQHTGRCCWIEF